VALEDYNLSKLDWADTEILREIVMKIQIGTRDA